MKFLFNGPRILALFAISISAVIFYQAYNSYSHINNLIKHGSTLRATITSVVHQRGKYPSTIYKADFKIKGEYYVASNDFITDDSRYQIGDPIDVIYDANNPNDSVINDKYERMTWLAYTAIGTIILGIVISILLYIRPRQPG